MRLILLIVLLFGCGVRPITIVPEVPKPVAVYNPVQDKTPIRGMDLLHEGMRDSTVSLIKVMVEKGEKSAESYCGGVWVGYDEILTAAHCVKDDKNPIDLPIGREVKYIISRELDPDGWMTFHHGKVISYDEAYDLVLIQATGKIPYHLVTLLAEELPAIGETVYSVGHPAKLYWSFVQGEISAYRKVSDLGNTIQVNITIWYGHSGGGLFDHDGRLIGICAQKHEIPAMSYFVHLDHIKSFLWEARLRRSAQ